MPTPDTCYVCGAPATSDDHAPPRVFFPEDKDLEKGEPSLRNNLYTYRACDLHNNARSRADTKACFAVVSNIDNNAVAQRQIITKVLRALKRDGKLAAELVAGGGPAVVDGKQVAVMKPDMDALTSVFEATVRGLHIRHVQRRLDIPLVWRSPSMRNAQHEMDTTTIDMWKFLAETPTNHPEFLAFDGFVGDPRVFRYDLWLSKADGRFLASRQFYYEGFSVLVLPKPGA